MIRKTAGETRSCAGARPNAKTQADDLIDPTAYLRFFEDAVQGMYRTSPDGRYLMVNRALARIHGCVSVEDFMGHFNGSAVGVYAEPGKRDLLVRRFCSEAVVSGFEYLGKRKDGTEIWVSESGRAIRDEEGEVVAFEGFVEDISERKAATAALEQKSRLLALAEERAAKALNRLQSAIESTADGFVLYDNQGRLVLCNSMHKAFFPEVAELTVPGTNRSLILQTYLDRVSSSHPDSVRDNFLRSRIQDPLTLGMTRERLLPDGRWLRISERALPDGGMVSVTTDITELKQQARNLQDSQQRLTEFVEVVSDRLWEMGPDLRFSYITYPNRNKYPPAAQLLGKTRWEVAGGNPYEDEKWIRHRETLEARLPFRDFRYQMKGTDGQAIYWRSSGRPIFDGQGNFLGYRGSAAEETEAVEAMQRASAADALLHKAISSMKDGFAQFDADDRLLVCNRRICEMYDLEIEPEDMVGKTFEELLRANIRKGFIADPHARQSPTDWVAERVKQHQNPTGEPFEQSLANDRWVRITEWATEDGGTVGIWTDITELKQAQERLMDAIESISQGFVLWDADDRLVLCNSKYRESYRNVSHKLVPGARFEDVMREAVATGQFVIQGSPDEWVRRRLEEHRKLFGTFEQELSDGQCRLVAERRTSDGGVVALFTDITDRKMAERSVLRAKEIAESADAAKSRFLAAASHDLRQPLAALKLLIYDLAQASDGGDQREIIDAMDVSINVMRSLLDSLLDIGQLDSGTVSPTIKDFAIETLIDQAVTQFEPQAKQKGLELRVVRSSAAVRSDIDLLERILDNFLGNAVRYTENGKILVGCRRRGDKLRLEVWDTGCGIEEGHRRRIFEEFYQIANEARRREKGLGLGLAIADRLARLLDHPIMVQSSLGHGSMFAIELPLGVAPKKPVASVVPVPQRAPVSLEGASVLLVEDDPNLADAMTRTLTKWGVSVVTANDGTEALQAILQMPGGPDLLLADYRLPGGITGVELCQALEQQIGIPLPTVILTGDTQPRSLDDIQASGRPCLQKPVSPAKLRALLHHLLYAPEEQPLTASAAGD